MTTAPSVRSTMRRSRALSQEPRNLVDGCGRLSVCLFVCSRVVELRILRDIVRAADAEWREGHRREPITLIKV